LYSDFHNSINSVVAFLIMFTPVHVVSLTENTILLTTTLVSSQVGVSTLVFHSKHSGCAMLQCDCTHLANRQTSLMAQSKINHRRGALRQGQHRAHSSHLRALIVSVLNLFSVPSVWCDNTGSAMRLRNLVRKSFDRTTYGQKSFACDANFNLREYMRRCLCFRVSKG
jgi:hypothetical protein